MCCFVIETFFLFEKSIPLTSIINTFHIWYNLYAPLRSTEKKINKHYLYRMIKVVVAKSSKFLPIKGVKFLF